MIRSGAGPGEVVEGARVRPGLGGRSAPQRGGPWWQAGLVVGGGAERGLRPVLLGRRRRGGVLRMFEAAGGVLAPPLFTLEVPVPQSWRRGSWGTPVLKMFKSRWRSKQQYPVSSAEDGLSRTGCRNGMAPVNGRPVQQLLGFYLRDSLVSALKRHLFYLLGV